MENRTLQVCVEPAAALPAPMKWAVLFLTSKRPLTRSHPTPAAAPETRLRATRPLAGAGCDPHLRGSGAQGDAEPWGGLQEADSGVGALAALCPLPSLPASSRGGPAPHGDSPRPPQRRLVLP